MMLYPPMGDLVNKIGSRYLLVNVVARRARDISAEAEENGTSLDDKPVSCAINEIYNGQLQLKTTDTCEQVEEAMEEAVEAVETEETL